MTAGTLNTTLVGNKEFAAMRIQQYFRGYRVRYNNGLHTKELVAVHFMRLLTHFGAKNDGFCIETDGFYTESDGFDTLAALLLEAAAE